MILALAVSTTLHLWWVLSVVPGFTTLFFPVLSWTVINGLIVLSVYIINCIIEASK